MKKREQGSIDKDFDKYFSDHRRTPQGGNHRIFQLTSSADREELSQLLAKYSNLEIYDEIISQVEDLVKLEHPNKSFSDQEKSKLIADKFGDNPRAEYGVWVYYPWRKCLVHLLSEEDFIRVRTVRNLYKITKEEQEILRSKKIGIIGLSVGQSAALAIALERIAGEIRIADFDSVELSNLNRIRSGVQNLSVYKTQIVYQEIAEIDPFILVTVFINGITAQNINEFLTANGNLDLVVEECDSIAHKFLIREECKLNGIPVLMETSDRGMIDIERYDVDKDYPVLHGYMDSSISFEFLDKLKSSEEKIPFVAPIVGIETMSSALKASMLEIGQSITSWPQISTEVILGGALVSHFGKKLLLNSNISSGRFWYDLDAVGNFKDIDNIPVIQTNTLDDFHIRKAIEDYPITNGDIVSNEALYLMLNDALLAPSPGNNQKWKWVKRRNGLYLFLDKARSMEFSDNLDVGSLLGLGAALENLSISAKTKGYETTIQYVDDPSIYPLAAIVTFNTCISISATDVLKGESISKRCTDRSKKDLGPISTVNLKNLTSCSLEGESKFLVINDKRMIAAIAELVGEADKIRFLNRSGHREFFNSEIRWNRKEAIEKGDGLDISLFNLSPKELVGLQIAKDARSLEILKVVGGGDGFKLLSKSYFDVAHSLGILIVPDYLRHTLLDAGRNMERIWILATIHGLNLHAMTSIQMLGTLIASDEQGYLQDRERDKLTWVWNSFHKLIGEDSGKSIFLFRITNQVELPVARSVRKPLSEKIIVAE